MADKQQPKTKPGPAIDLVYEKGLPANLDAERFVLGSLLKVTGETQRDLFTELYVILDDFQQTFSLEKHRRIFARMKDLFDRNEPIDRLTVASELMTQGQLESVDGLTYVVSLDEGMPTLAHPEAYARLVKEAAEKRRLIFLGQKVIDTALLETPSREIVEGLTKELQLIEGARVSLDDGGRTPIQIVDEFPGGINAFLDPTLQVRGMSTGFTRFDDMTTGLHAGEVIVIAARPSMGKSTLASNIVEYLALAPRLKKHCAVFSLEMSKASLLTRMLCSTAYVDHHKFRAGYLNADERRKLQEALFKLTEAKIDIYDKAGMMWNEMVAIIRHKVREEGLHLAVIDYLQLIGSHMGEDVNRNQVVSGIMRGCKMVATDCGIPLIILSQLSRATERRPGSGRPILSDLRDSGSIEQDADVVAFIHREEMYKRDREDLKGKAELIIAKQRNGPTGVIKLKFLGKFLKFVNAVEESEQQELVESS